jgi:hypothetical protein
MYLPQFVVGMFVAAFVAAILAYVETGSVLMTLGWAILGAIMIQAGYVGLVVRLVYERTSDASDAGTGVEPVASGRPVEFVGGL